MLLKYNEVRFNMKKMQKKNFLTIMLVGLCVMISISSTDNESRGPSILIASTQKDAVPVTSSISSDFIDSLLNQEIEQYESHGFSSSYYQPSLQATYQAISILNAIGGLSQVDESEILEYIMECYTADNSSFIDIVALRYLDADFSQQYYPLQTYLEITCYAVLTLNMLEQLDRIDVQKVLNFIWSCYQPVTSGFIGQPYKIDLDPKAKLSTMDNIYYALLTLEVLGFDWSVHASEQDALVNFISTSQAGNGGFFNDKDYVFDSLDTYEPGLFSSFFALHSLELLNMLETVRINDFKDYLAGLYDPVGNFFQISEYPYYNNETNIIASAIGLELSDLSSFTGIDRTALIKFIFSGRDALGGWSSSTNVPYHELVDTFQVVRSLKNAGEIDSISYNDLAEVSGFVAMFRSLKGYAPLPPDYQAVSQLNALATSFRRMNRANELPLQSLYDDIEWILFTFYTQNGKEFGGTTGMYPDRVWFRSNPIEFATRCAHQYIPYLNAFTSIKWTSLALESLNALYKLDDLPYHHDLTQMLNAVIDSQFLDEGDMKLFGGFMNSIRMVRFSVTKQVQTVFLENAYYAIQIVQTLSTLLENNHTVSELLLDSDALISYVAHNMDQMSGTYFIPRYGSLPEDILEHTYQAYYILKSLGEPDVDHQKITAYIQNHIDYGNLKNIYFAYKIKELYGLDFDFDISATQQLVQATYNADENNFYGDLTLKTIEPRAFGWVVEMAKNDEVNIAIQMNDIVHLGGMQHITVSIGNMVLSQLGKYATVKFQSSLLGTQTFAVQPDGTHHANITIPMEPSYFPVIEGNLTVYDGLDEIKRKSISFQTSYELLTNYAWKNESGVILVNFNASQVCGTVKVPLLYGNAFGKIFKDNSFLRTLAMTRDDNIDCSEFSLSYVPLNYGNYTIELYLNDGFNQTDKGIGEVSFGVLTPPNINPNPNPLNRDEISTSVGLIIGFISLPGMTFFLSKRFLNNKKLT
jgi:prenyltransferase beta subunit